MRSERKDLFRLLAIGAPILAIKEVPFAIWQIWGVLGAAKEKRPVARVATAVELDIRGGELSAQHIAEVVPSRDGQAVNHHH